MGAVACLRAVQ
jgi:peroxiredoxin